MIRSALFSAVLAVSLSGCETMNSSGGDGDLADRVRAELATDPVLNSAGITVRQRDGVVVLGGFVDSLEEINAIRDLVQNVEGVGSVRNEVIVQADG